MRKSQSHVEEGEERSAKEKDLAIAFPKRWVIEIYFWHYYYFHFTGLQTKTVVQILIQFSEVQVKDQIAVTTYSHLATIRLATQSMCKVDVESLHVPSPHAACPNYQSD